MAKKSEPAQPSAGDPLAALVKSADAAGAPQDDKPVTQPEKPPAEALREILQPEDVEALVEVYGYDNLPRVKEFVRREAQSIADKQRVASSLEAEVAQINQQWGVAVGQAEQAIDAAPDAAARKTAVENYRNLVGAWVEALRDAEFKHSFEGLPVELTPEEKRELAAVQGQPAAVRMRQYAQVYHKAMERAAVERAPVVLKQKAEQEAGLHERLAKVLGILAQYRGGKVETVPRPAQVGFDELSRMSREEFEQYLREQGMRQAGV